MTRPSVGRLGSRSVSKKGGKLHFHAPIGELVNTIHIYDICKHDVTKIKQNGIGLQDKLF